MFVSLPGIFVVLTCLLSILAVILAFVFIIPEKKRGELNKFGKLLHDVVNFKFLIVEKILCALYIFATVFSFFTGFFMLFIVKRAYFSDSYVWYGGYGILLMLLGPVVIRLVFELLMMAILLVKNVISINNRLSNQGKTSVPSDPFASPVLSEFKSHSKHEANSQNTGSTDI